MKSTSKAFWTLLLIVMLASCALAQDTTPSGLFTQPLSELDKSLLALDFAHLVVALQLDQAQLARTQTLLSGYQRSLVQDSEKFAKSVAEAKDPLAAVRDALLKGKWPKSDVLNKFNRLFYEQTRNTRLGHQLRAKQIVAQFRSLLKPEQAALIRWYSPAPEKARAGDSHEQQVEKHIVDTVLQAVETVKYSNRQAYLTRRVTEAQRVLEELKIPPQDPSYDQRMRALQQLFADARLIPEAQYPQAQDTLAQRALQIFADLLPSNQQQQAANPLVDETRLAELLLSPGAPTVAAARLEVLRQAGPPPTPAARPGPR